MDREAFLLSWLSFKDKLLVSIICISLLRTSSKETLSYKVKNTCLLSLSLKVRESDSDFSDCLELLSFNVSESINDLEILKDVLKKEGII